MSSEGYIYVTHWEQIQGRRDRNDPWHKVYNELLRHDEYCSLSLADRGTLHGLWMLASSTGDGRVTSSRTFLARQLNVRRVSLEPLINAGFIEIRAAKRPRDGGLEESRREESREEPLDVSRNRNGRAQGTAAEDQPKNGDHPKPELPASLARILDEKITASLTADQVELITIAWDTSVELRHSMASIESAENPTAMLVSVARRIAGPAADPATLAQRAIAKRMAAVHRCRFLWCQARDAGDEDMDGVREDLEHQYRHDPSIILEAIGAP